MSRIMKSGKFDRSRQLQRCAESGTPRICYYTGFPEPHDEQCEALPLLGTLMWKEKCDEILRKRHGMNIANQTICPDITGLAMSVNM
jgi:hypothetical protein